LAKTYADYLSEIERLKEKAEDARRKEVAGVVDRIKDAIAHYGLTATDLGLDGGTAPAARDVKKAGPKARKTKQAVAAPAAKYSDGQGNTWSGRGPKPRWFKQALAAGKSPDELTGQVQSAPGESDAPSAPAPAKKAKPAVKKAAPVVKFKDDAGHTWSGMGPKPKWLKDALDAGKTLQELTA
jgi:DNA-binding protein H-NS